jgi:hypothetical protein
MCHEWNWADVPCTVKSNGAANAKGIISAGSVSQSLTTVSAATVGTAFAE